MSSSENVVVSARAQNSQRIRMIVTLGMLVAIAYAVMWVCKPIPKVMGILQFDLKDAVIVIGGLIYGPLAAAASAFAGRGLYRQWGISPRPEDSHSVVCCYYSTPREKCNPNFCRRLSNDF